MSERTVKISSFAPGLNNRLEPTQLEVTLADRSKATYLYAAENVDIDEKGGMKRRQGRSSVLDGASHSLWSDTTGAYAVIADELVRLTPAGAGLTVETVRTAMPRLPLSYSRGADGDVYWSNGQLLRRISAGVDCPPHAEPPDAIGPYEISIGSVGGLAAGKYLVAYTNITADGESPATPVVQLDVPEGGSIALTGQHHLYMSGPNGDILTYQGYGDWFIAYDPNGRVCQTLNTALMPPGTIVRHYQGRMVVAQGKTLYYSNPYHYGIYDPSAGYFAMTENITVVEPTDNGLYICADKTYWLADFVQATLQEVLPYGGIAGTSGRTANTTEVYWQSPQGLIVADKNQSLKAVQEEALAFSQAAAGASLFREKDGMTHIVSTRFGAEPSVAVATSYMEAEIVRKGTVL